MIEKNNVKEKQERVQKVQEQDLNKKIRTATHQKMANFVKGQIYHRDNPQKFNQQLQEQLQLAYKSMEAQIQRQKDKQSKLMSIEAANLKFRQQWKLTMDAKSRQSLKKKEQIIQNKVKKITQRRQRYQQIAKYKNQEAEKKKFANSLLKLRHIYQEQINNNQPRPSLTKSLAQLPINCKERKQFLEQSINNKLRTLAKQKKVFQIPKFQHKQINLIPQVPRITQKQKQAQDILDNMLQHLKKIEAARKKKSQNLSKLTEKKHEREKFTQNTINERLKEIAMKDQAKRKQIIQKESARFQSVMFGKSSKLSYYTTSRKSSNNIVSDLKESIEINESLTTKVQKSYKEQIRQNLKNYIHKELEYLKLNLR